MNYPSIIEKLKKRGSVPGLASIGRLLDELGRPERKLNIVHIAGTNGKGSVFAFLSSVLEEGGYRVGRYVSPTINCYEERFQINRHFIEETELEDCFLEIDAAIQRMEKKGFERPTLFEAETALAFLYFVKKKVDFALIETGMGGTLDATNIIERPLLTVITSISMDHKGILGNTLEEIAANKAGIIKENVPVVLAENKIIVCNIIEETAKKKRASLTKINAADYVVEQENCDGSTFLWKEKVYSVKLPGRHQIANAVAALCAAEMLHRIYDPKNTIGESAMKAGLEKTVWQGRLELLSRRPYFYRDGAHNPDGARKLAAFLEKHFTNKRIIYIMGVLKDKEYEAMLQYLMPIAEFVYVFQPNNERGLSGEQLWKAVQKYHVPAEICENVNEAVKKALSKSGKEDVLVACGSLSFMEEMEVLL